MRRRHSRERENPRRCACFPLSWGRGRGEGEPFLRSHFRSRRRIFLRTGIRRYLLRSPLDMLHFAAVGRCFPLTLTLSLGEREQHPKLFVFDSPQEVLPLCGREHPGQVAVRPGERGWAETKILDI